MSKPSPDPQERSRAWRADQMSKSLFFHQKLHEWGLLAVAEAIEEVPGETLDWDLDTLNIQPKAWKRAIHHGIRPVTVFAHPEVLRTVSRGVAYYRMLAMLSQKSMARVGLPVQRFEREGNTPDPKQALQIARHLNAVLSELLLLDEVLQPREFDLWRGMAAGSQAQGSWQNSKGKHAEDLVKDFLRRRALRAGVPVNPATPPIEAPYLRFADEPDVALYGQGVIQVAVEIKGGIDPAGVLERLGAALKSLRRAKESNPQAVTILLLQKVSLTDRAISDLEIHADVLDYWFTIEDVLEDATVRSHVLTLLRLEEEKTDAD